MKKQRNQKDPIKVPEVLRDKLVKLSAEEMAVVKMQDHANDYAARCYAGINSAKTEVWKELFAAAGMEYNPNFAAPQWTIDFKTSTLRPLSDDEKDKVALRAKRL